MINFTQAYTQALDEAMAADPTVVLLGEDIGDKEGGGVFKVTAGLSTKHGAERVRQHRHAHHGLRGEGLATARAGRRRAGTHVESREGMCGGETTSRDLAESPKTKRKRPPRSMDEDEESRSGGSSGP